MSKEHNQEKKDSLESVSYIKQLMIDIENLTHNHTIYYNQILEITGGKTESEIEDLELGEKQADYIAAIRAIRTSVMKVYAKYVALISTINKEPTKELMDSYKTLVSKVYIELDVLNKFVIEMNKAFVKEILKDLLKNNEDIISKIYDG